MRGKVYIVGAGPGDPGLITLRGLELIRISDVIIYDRLVHPELLNEAPAAAELIYAGKESGVHTMRQEEINELLAINASIGRVVVRLKGGDPFVFGRGGEEAAFLSARGIEFEVVPGVSSALAVPASAGIPLTFRGVATSFAVTTGHRCTGGSPPDYAALFRAAGNLVILMGVDTFPEIRHRLLNDGVDGSVPVAFIESGTLSSQRTVTTTLADAMAGWQEVQPPTVIVIGPTVSLREQIVRIPEPVLAHAGGDETNVAAWPGR